MMHKEHTHKSCFSSWCLHLYEPFIPIGQTSIVINYNHTLFYYLVWIWYIGEVGSCLRLSCICIEVWKNSHKRSLCYALYGKKHRFLTPRKNCLTSTNNYRATFTKRGTNGGGNVWGQSVKTSKVHMKITDFVDSLKPKQKKKF